MHPIPNSYLLEKKFLDKIHNGVSSDLSQAVFTVVTIIIQNAF